MADKEPQDKDVEGNRAKTKKPPGFRRFETLLKQVVTAPPLRTQPNACKEN
jgi:hypothetical protein